MTPLDSIPFPKDHGLYYGGAWRPSVAGGTADIVSPATGELLTRIQLASPADVPLAVAAARSGFETWRDVMPQERARLLRKMADVIRAHGQELALIDSHDCGNPLSDLLKESARCAWVLDYFAGLVTEMKGYSIPHGPDTISFSVREPYGVVVRIAPSNHPLLFTIAKAAPALAAGNAVILKPADQAPLSTLRAMEILDGILPPGVLNVLAGGRDVGAALAADPGVAMVTIVGSVAAGRSVLHAAAETIKPTMMELGGKNALIALPDSDPDKVAAGMCRGMNYIWAGQSASSPSRAFLHEDIHDAVLECLPRHLEKYRPGLPQDPQTTMGSLIDRDALARVESYIALGQAEGATLFYGGHRPADPALANGCFILPTVFTNVTMDMRIANEEIFGPVQSILRWKDEAEMLRQVNQVDYGMSCSVWTRDIAKAHRILSRVEAGYCWINDASRHAHGSPFGGYKQSGLGREECLDELLAFTQEKNIIIDLNG